MKLQYQQAFIEKCAFILAPFSGSKGISCASMWAMLGAADSLSDAAVRGDLTETQARDELHQTILAMIGRSK